MRRPSAGPDPLLLLLLSSLGVGNAAGCGGQSMSEVEEQDTSGGDTTVGGIGGVTGGVGGATGGVGGGGRPPVTEGPTGCTNPTFPYGEESGYVACEEGFFHRAGPGRCAQTPLRAGAPTDAIAPACGSDADCADLPNGRCYGNALFGQVSCVSSCETDADCRPGFACFCGPVANLCVPTNCESDADCGGNLLCASYTVPTGACSASTGFACQLPNDGCTTSCPAGYVCKTDTENEPISRDCVGQAGVGGTCGRPFLVAGTERLAEAGRRSDWCTTEQPAPDLRALTPAERAALAAHYRDAGLMEHASIAAFARFALQLLALGAPASLVQETTAALGDEQRHATTCFALASAFAGAPVGPGPLPVRDCLAAVDLGSVTVTTFLEGCIGETIAAVEARELALSALDPVLRHTLATIADDEARHALLAWSFLRWALERGGPELAARIRDTWRAETKRNLASDPQPRGVTAPAEERALALGLPPPDFRRDVRRRVLYEIVKPCLEGLTQGARSAPGGWTTAASSSMLARSDEELQAPPLGPRRDDGFRSA